MAKATHILLFHTPHPQRKAPLNEGSFAVYGILFVQVADKIRNVSCETLKYASEYVKIYIFPLILQNNMIYLIHYRAEKHET